MVKQMGDLFIQHHFSLVYGGAKVGLMGQLANRVLQSGGEVTGIMPGFLVNKEVAHHGLTRLVEVSSMHERKALMQEESDGFIALPGGFGTVEEIFEMITWGQLSIHQKPCALLNINGFYDFMNGFLDNAVNEGFIEKEFKDMIIIESEPETVIHRMLHYQHPKIDKAAIALNKIKP
jgi:uncharacterized protein (TIGR00730 family)